MSPHQAKLIWNNIQPVSISASISVTDEHWCRAFTQRATAYACNILVYSVNNTFQDQYRPGLHLEDFSCSVKWFRSNVTSIQHTQ